MRLVWPYSSSSSTRSMAAVVVPIVFVIAVGVAYFVYRRKRNREMLRGYEAELLERTPIPPVYSAIDPANKAGAAELDGQARNELERNERLPELQSGKLAHELDRNERLPELQAGRAVH